MAKEIPSWVPPTIPGEAKPGVPPTPPQQKVMKNAEGMIEIARHRKIISPEGGPGAGIKAWLPSSFIIRNLSRIGEGIVKGIKNLGESVPKIVAEPHRPPPKPPRPITPSHRAEVSKQGVKAKPLESPIDTLCSIISQLETDKKLMLEGGQVKSIDRQKSFLSYLFFRARTGASKDAKKAAESTLSQLSDFAEKAKNDPEVMEKLRQALQELGHSPWFQGVLDHHPEVGKSLFETAQKLLPPPQENIAPWIELSACVHPEAEARLFSEFLRAIPTDIERLTEQLKEAMSRKDETAVEGILQRVVLLQSVKPTVSPQVLQKILQLEKECASAVTALTFDNVKGKISEYIASLRKMSAEGSFEVIHRAFDEVQRLSSLRYPKDVEEAIEALRQECEKKYIEHARYSLNILLSGVKEPEVLTQAKTEFSIAMKRLSPGGRMVVRQMALQGKEAVDRGRVLKEFEPFSKPVVRTGVNDRLQEAIASPDKATKEAAIDDIQHDLYELSAENFLTSDVSFGNVRAFRDATSSMVQKSILTSQNMTTARQTYEFWIDVAQKCQEKGDLVSAQAIVISLLDDVPSVGCDEARHEWYIDPSHQKTLQDLEALVYSADKNKNSETLVFDRQTHQLPTIPLIRTPDIGNRQALLSFQGSFDLTQKTDLSSILSSTLKPMEIKNNLARLRSEVPSLPPSIPSELEVPSELSSEVQEFRNQMGQLLSGELKLTMKGAEVVPTKRAAGIFISRERVGSSEEAREASVRTLRKLQTLMERCKQYPGSENLKIALKNAFLDLASTEWFHGVVQHHPELADSFLETAQELLPLPDEKGIEDWIDLARSLPAQNATAISNYIQTWKKVTGEVIALRTLSKPSEKQPVSQIEEGKSKADSLVSEYIDKGIPLPSSLKNEIQNLKAIFDKKFHEQVIPEAKEKAAALKSKVESSSSLDDVKKLYSEISQLKAKNFPEPVGKEISELYELCSKKLRDLAPSQIRTEEEGRESFVKEAQKLADTLRSDLKHSTPGKLIHALALIDEVKIKELPKELGIAFTDLQTDYWNKAAELTKATITLNKLSLTDLQELKREIEKRKDNPAYQAIVKTSLQAITEEEMRRALFLTLLPMQTRERVSGEVPIGIQRLIEDFSSGSAAKILQHIQPSAFLFTTLRKIAGEVEKSQVQALSDFVRLMARERKRTPLPANEAQQSQDLINSIATKLSEISEDPTIGEAIRADAQSDATNLQEMFAKPTTSIRDVLRQVRQTFRLFSPSDRKAITEKILALPPAYSFQKAEILKFIKEENVRRKIRLACDTTYFSDEMEKETSDAAKIALSEEAVDITYKLPAGISRFDVVEVLKTLVEEAHAKNDTAMLERYNDLLSTWVKSQKKTPLPVNEEERALFQEETGKVNETLLDISILLGHAEMPYRL